MRIGPGVFGPGAYGAYRATRTPAAVLAAPAGPVLHGGADLAVGLATELVVGRMVDLAAGLGGTLRSLAGRLVRAVARDVAAVLRSRAPAVVALLTAPRTWSVAAAPALGTRPRAVPAGSDVGSRITPLVPAPRAPHLAGAGRAEPRPEPGRHELALPADPTAPGRARALLQDAARAWGLDDELYQDAAMVVTELVANAVDHARTPSTLTLELADADLRVAVRDARPGSALRALPVNPAAPRGRGLQMIEALASSWGVTPDGDGKTVWAVLPCR